MSREQYEDVPYPTNPRAETQPSLLLALGRLHGIPTASPEACRTLELGCGDGGNLLAAASLWPESEFLGIDLAPNHVATARENAAALRLTNVRFEVGDIVALEPGFETFDCIVTHGVFSWVPRRVQKRLLALYRTCLAPNGVGTIGLKTYPGWHRLSLARDIIQFGGKRRGGRLEEQLKAGLETLDFLAEQAEPERLYSAMLRSLQSNLEEGYGVKYLVHEYLEAVSDPIRYDEFAERIRSHELTLLCDARYAEAVPENFLPPEARERFGALAGDDEVARQQLLDLLIGRSFRRPVLVRTGTPITAPNPEVVSSLWAFAPQHGVSLEETDLAPIVTLLRQAAPSAMSFSELQEATQSPPEELAQTLLATHRQGGLELLAHPCRAARTPGERPRAYPYARLCATRMGPVFNIRQERLELNPFVLVLLTRIDGKRDRAALLAQLVELARTGVLGIAAPDGSPLSDDALRATLAPALEDALQQLAGAGILLPATDDAAPVD